MHTGKKQYERKAMQNDGSTIQKNGQVEVCAEQTTSNCKAKFIKEALPCEVHLAESEP